jgi:hypothetical protein
MQDLPSTVCDDEEAVQQLESHGRDREEVKGHDHLAMVLQKSKPPLSRVTAALDLPKISRHGPFRDDETELLQLSVDLGRSPIRVFLRQATDQYANLFGDLRSAASAPRSPAPVQPETSAVPTDDSLGVHDDQNISPARPEVAEGSPKESVQPVQHGSRPLSFEHGDLLPEGKNFQGRVGSA